jgi:deazaflavin-dependent oxidoreductase (nitroreductase family)
MTARRDEADTGYARFHFIGRALARPQARVVRLLHGYLSRAPQFVLLTTRGRRTGLPREVPLPCVRTDDAIIVYSTYGEQSNWLRNLRRDPYVRVTAAGHSLPARAEVVDDVARRQAIAVEHPMFGFGPIFITSGPLLALLRPLLRPLMRWWSKQRPMVIIHLQLAGDPSHLPLPQPETSVAQEVGHAVHRYQ